MKICFFGTYDKTYTSNKLTIQGFRESGAEVVEVNAEVKITELTKKSELGWWPLLKRILRKYKIVIETILHAKDIASSDVIYVGYPGHFDIFSAWIVAKVFGKPLVFNPLLIFYTGFADEQGIMAKGSFMGRLAKFVEGIIYNLCDVVIADTPYQEKFMKKLFHVPSRKIRTVALGGDDKFYAYTPYTNKSKKIRIGYYGLYSPIHGVEYILEAAKRFKNDPDITFDMVGNRGQTFERSLEWAKKNELTNVAFHYDMPQSQHIPIVQKSDIFFGFLAKHPSVERVIPNKVYQGLSLGKVVLTADSEVIRSVFTNRENIYTVPPANVNALVEAILELKNNPALRTRIAQNGHSLFVKSFSPKAVGGNILNAIQQIIPTK